MADVFSKEKRSEIMSRIKGKDTKPERLVRSLLHRMGYRFRLHVSDLRGKPDVVLARHRKVIFVNGCFWHGHQACRKKNPPKTNKKFWSQKILGNMRRDKLTRSELRKKGWRTLTIWECDTGNIEKIVSKLDSFMKS
jgi:DNA mismatch endonuclease (patch repair protein)